MRNSRADSRVYQLGQLFSDIAAAYKAVDIPLKVPDGSKPFPDEGTSVAEGVAIEFRCESLNPFNLLYSLTKGHCLLRNVSFRYPESNYWALKGVSFTLRKGGLCVSQTYTSQGSDSTIY
jgi:ABC-type multidrug transport system fused ATPase/permease subunit